MSVFIHFGVALGAQRTWISCFYLPYLRQQPAVLCKTEQQVSLKHSANKLKSCMCPLYRFHTLGLLPPMAPGLMEPVSWYRHRILDTQPCETRSCLEITHGLMPWWAISTILCRMWLGRGLPLMKTPPSWFTRPWPSGVDTILQQHEKSFSGASKVSNPCWKTTLMCVN